ncbi:hypothetical protein QKT49_gp363 [Acanthamoeba castellanii medusavirus]|uniref:Uncharacterized protein n=1 Tax=Acanthamoeba castellanii medusavirus J1 TaxID=3114988 RepID=A0A3T1CX41_9VIRU|nr:hypothetical protein QKT49_gp363 [Acanthamoeba castellanii medusavirus]BBI30400.1 hypothetical protein [Acanthamoeba castellanii medusavirus J1]
MSTIEPLIRRLPHGRYVPEKEHLPPHCIYPDASVVLSDGSKCRYHSFVLCTLSEYFARGLEFASAVPFEPRFDDYTPWVVLTGLNFAYEPPTKDAPLRLSVWDYVRLASFLGFIQMPMPEHVQFENVETYQFSTTSIRLRFNSNDGGVLRLFETDLEDGGQAPRQFINSVCDYLEIPPNIATLSFGSAERFYTTGSGKRKAYIKRVGIVDGREILFDYSPCVPCWLSVFKRMICACYGVPF